MDAMTRTDPLFGTTFGAGGAAGMFGNAFSGFPLSYLDQAEHENKISRSLRSANVNSYDQRHYNNRGFWNSDISVVFRHWLRVFFGQNLFDDLDWGYGKHSGWGGVLGDKPRPLACQKCGAMPVEPFLRGSVYSPRRRFFRRPFICVICSNCEKVIGYEDLRGNYVVKR